MPSIDRTTRTSCASSKGLSLFRIARRIIAPIFPADVLSARLVRWLFLSSLVANDTLLR
jgi:hypothetical protein